jgi:uncharacterized protein (TIGR02145 family)
MNGATPSSSSPSGIQGVCPTGWHLPSDDEWTILTDYLGGTDVAGGALKETDTIHWRSPNIGATNESGFTALPSGYRVFGTFYYIGEYGVWWSTTEYEEYPGVCRGRYLGYDVYSTSVSGTGNQAGMSVRCLKDP